MAFTKEELKQIGNVVVDVTTPMFEQVFERLDGVESRMSGLERDLSDFKSEVRQRFEKLEQKIDDQTMTIEDRLKNMNEDIEFLYKLTDMLDHGTPAEKKFAKLTIEKQVPILYRSLEAIAKKAGVQLPQ